MRMIRLAVLAILVLLPACSGGGATPTAPPPPPVPRATITLTLTDLRTVRTDDGHDYHIRFTATEVSGVASMLGTMSLSIFRGDTLLSTAVFDTAFAGPFDAHGTKAANTVSRENHNRPLADRVSAVLRYTDAGGAGTVVGTADVPPPPPGGQ